MTIEAVIAKNPSKLSCLDVPEDACPIVLSNRKYSFMCFGSHQASRYYRLPDATNDRFLGGLYKRLLYLARPVVALSVAVAAAFLLGQWGRHRMLLEVVDGAAHIIEKQ